jgi:hypothetical protein
LTLARLPAIFLRMLSRSALKAKKFSFGGIAFSRAPYG